MEFTARPDSLVVDDRGEVKITLIVNERQYLKENYDSIRNLKELSVEIKQFRNKRSLDANAYMWVLLSKLAVVLDTTKDELYKQMLERYSIAFTHTIVKPSAVDRVLQMWRTARVIGKVKVNGVEGVQIQCYYGSSTFDTQEMSVVIDGIVSECKELGIETLPPEELNKMKREWNM